MNKTEEWICKSCIHYPPSACDGKPCCICDADSVYPVANCYKKKRRIMSNKNLVDDLEDE